MSSDEQPQALEQGQITAVNQPAAAPDGVLFSLRKRNHYAGDAIEIDILLIYEPLLPDVDPVRAAQDAQVIAFNIDQRLAELFFLVDDSRDGQKLCRGALQILHGAEQLQKPQLSIVPQ